MTQNGRRLSPEEQRLWQKITDTTTPLETRPTFLKEPSKAALKQTPRKSKPNPDFRVGEKAGPAKAATRITAPDQPLRMDRKTFAKMKRGKSIPEARIDLHGMTADVAHSALRAFLLKSHGEGKRLVLVITGKGMRRDGDSGSREFGVLRRQVPHWLDQPPLRQVVLQTAPAHQRHGGTGALYVYLRR